MFNFYVLLSCIHYHKLYRTMANKIETSPKNIKPRMNLNHNIYRWLSDVFITSINNTFNKWTQIHSTCWKLFTRNISVDHARRTSSDFHGYQFKTLKSKPLTAHPPAASNSMKTLKSNDIEDKTCGKTMVETSNNDDNKKVAFPLLKL